MGIVGSACLKLKAGIGPASFGGWWNGCEQRRGFAPVWGCARNLLRRDEYRSDLAERCRMDAAMARLGARCWPSWQ